MRVLLAEDDPDIRETLTKLLEENGFLVDACADGESAMTQGLENDYAVAILDFGLPIFSGEQIVARWRNKGRRFPIIAVTGTRNMREQIQELIKLGVDQYFGKPIMDYELLIDWIKGRVNTGMQGSHGAVIRRGELEVDTDNLVVRYKGKRVDLSPAQFGVLRFLALNEGPPLTAKVIAARCFDERDGLKEQQVRVHIARIREKFGFNIIVSVGAAQGYSLAA